MKYKDDFPPQVGSTLNLFLNLETTEGRHNYITGKASKPPADIGPQHRWAVGTLYGNITTDGEINVQDRGNWGTGYGWYNSCAMELQGQKGCCTKPMDIWTEL